MDKNAKPPIKWDDIKRDKGVPPKGPYVKGTIEPTTKK